MLNKLKLASIASFALVASGLAFAANASDDGKDGKDGDSKCIVDSIDGYSHEDSKCTDDGKDGKDGEDGMDGKYGYHEGCTPGYWKQEHHFDSWPYAYDPYSYEKYFNYEFDVWGKPYEVILPYALKMKGGKEYALMRHATAALLNASHPGVYYKYDVWQVKDMVKKALYPYNKKMIEKVKDKLEDANEQGCPLS